VSEVGTSKHIRALNLSLSPLSLVFLNLKCVVCVSGFVFVSEKKSKAAEKKKRDKPNAIWDIIGESVHCPSTTADDPLTPFPSQPPKTINNPYQSTHPPHPHPS